MTETLRPYVDLRRIAGERSGVSDGRYCEEYVSAVELHNWLKSALVPGPRRNDL
jgi:hypothetical protein